MFWAAIQLRIKKRETLIVVLCNGAFNLMMDEKKKAAAIRGARKLAELNTPQDEIISTLIELGLREDEARQVIAESASVAGAEKAQAPKKEEQAAVQDAPQEQETENKAQPRPAQAFRKAAPAGQPSLWKKISPFKKSYIPKLRTGGRRKIREIIADSPLDAKG